MSRNRAAALAEFYATLTPAALERLGEYYAPAARFLDPFNDVVGLDAIARIFRHMFATLDSPRFEVEACLGDEAQAMLVWNFHFSVAGRRHAIRGMTHVRFDEDGRVMEHIDHWDPARQLYEHIPVLGIFLRGLRRRLRAR